MDIPLGKNTGIEMGFNFDLGTLVPSRSSSSASQNQTQTRSLKIDQAGIDKLIYDVLSSDQGLAALSGGENIVGGSASSTKALLSQDLVTKLIGEIAKLTAEETVSTTSSQSSSSKKKPSIICTKLYELGLLEKELYLAAREDSAKVAPETYSGYISWAQYVVPRMTATNLLSKLLLPIVKSRYRLLAGYSKFEPLGATTIYIGQPICFAIGAILNLRGKYGRVTT